MTPDRVRVLLVEDERDYARLLQTVLKGAKGRDFAVEVASTLADALGRARHRTFDVVVLDLGLPDSKGAATVERLHTEAPQLPIVVLSGQDDDTTVYQALEGGAQEYLVKDAWSKELFLHALDYAIERQRAEESARRCERKYQELADSLPQIVFELNREARVTFANRHALNEFGYTQADLDRGLNGLEMLVPEDRERAGRAIREVLEGAEVADLEFTALRRDGSTFPVATYARPILEQGSATGVRGILIDVTERLAAAERQRKIMEGTIRAIGLTTELRDPYTAGHQRRVSELATAIGAEMGLPSDQVEGIRIAGLLHDIGKISVPAEILSKPTSLDPAEFELIKAHPRVGFEILHGIDFPWPLAEIVHQHHERADGTGYPRGLKGRQMLVEAKILCVSDVVEAMASHRPYRPAVGIEKALEEIRGGRGRAYDAAVADACLNVFEEKSFAFSA